MDKIKHKKSTPDALDVRINKLIARYSDVCESFNAEEANPSSKINKNSSKRNKYTSITQVTQYKTSRVYAYAVNNANYIYKFRHSSDSSKENDERILMTYHDNCNSSDSNDADNDTSITKQNVLNIGQARPKQKVRFRDDYQQTSLENIPEKSYAEKTTYCRPVKNKYDISFVDKVMERNAKLQMLLIKHLINRQKEKETEKWKKGSSKYFSSEYVSKKNYNPKLTQEYYDQNSNLRKSDSYREMLQEVYHTPDEVNTENLTGYESKDYYDESMSSRMYGNKHNYLPYASEDTRKYESRDSIDSHRTYDKPTNVIHESILSRPTSKTDVQHVQQIQSNSLYQLSVIDMMQTRDVQTHITLGGYSIGKCTDELDIEIQTTSNEIHAILKNIDEAENIFTKIIKHDTVANPIQTLKEVNNVTKPTIQDLEEKLNTVIHLFNSFASGFRPNEIADENISNDKVSISVDNNQHVNEIGVTDKSQETTSIVGNAMTNTSFCAFDSNAAPSHSLMNMKLEKILHEELDKSNKIRSEIADMLSTSRSPVKVNVEIPTKERSTEVTASLSKTKLQSRSDSVFVKDISYREVPERQDRRIAVNTEPLGLLTLLRLSTEAVKQILSFLPDLSCYLTRDSRPVRGNANYICNICGAAFARPSQLSAHILCHDLGQSRDCSVCRHSVDQRRPSQLFRCQHCGQLFTRAYCCELHQRVCQAGHGLRSSVPSLALLR